MSPEGDIMHQSSARPNLKATAKQSPSNSKWHYLAFAVLGLQAYQMVATPNVQWTTTTAEWIIGIILTLLSIAGWLYFLTYNQKHLDNAAFSMGGPVLLVILSTFSLFFLWGFVWDALCPDNDDDDCVSEATVIFMTFAVFFVCILYLVVCCYRLIDRIA